MTPERCSQRAVREGKTEDVPHVVLGGTVSWVNPMILARTDAERDKRGRGQRSPRGKSHRPGVVRETLLVG